MLKYWRLEKNCKRLRIRIEDPSRKRNHSIWFITNLRKRLTIFLFCWILRINFIFRKIVPNFKVFPVGHWFRSLLTVHSQSWDDSSVIIFYGFNRFYGIQGNILMWSPLILCQQTILAYVSWEIRFAKNAPFIDFDV